MSHHVYDEAHVFRCPECPKEYGHKRNLDRHRNSVHLNLRHACHDCGIRFREKYDLRKHDKTCKGGTSPKRKMEEPGENTPGKKQKLSDEELIAFEVFTQFRFLFSSLPFVTAQFHTTLCV